MEFTSKGRHSSLIQNALRNDFASFLRVYLRQQDLSFSTFKGLWKHHRMGLIILFETPKGSQKFDYNVYILMVYQAILHLFNNRTISENSIEQEENEDEKQDTNQSSNVTESQQETILRTSASSSSSTTVCSSATLPPEYGDTLWNIGVLYCLFLAYHTQRNSPQTDVGNSSCIITGYTGIEKLRHPQHLQQESQSGTGTVINSTRVEVGKPSLRERGSPRSHMGVSESASKPVAISLSIRDARLLQRLAHQCLHLAEFGMTAVAMYRKLLRLQVLQFCAYTGPATVSQCLFYGKRGVTKKKESMPSAASADGGSVSTTARHSTDDPHFLPSFPSLDLSILRFHYKSSVDYCNDGSRNGNNSYPSTTSDQSSTFTTTTTTTTATTTTTSKPAAIATTTAPAAPMMLVNYLSNSIPYRRELRSQSLQRKRQYEKHVVEARHQRLKERLFEVKLKVDPAASLQTQQQQQLEQPLVNRTKTTATTTTKNNNNNNNNNNKRKSDAAFVGASSKLPRGTTATSDSNKVAAIIDPNQSQPVEREPAGQKEIEIEVVEDDDVGVVAMQAANTPSLSDKQQRRITGDSVILPSRNQTLNYSPRHAMATNPRRRRTYAMQEPRSNAVTATASTVPPRIPSTAVPLSSVRTRTGMSDTGRTSTTTTTTTTTAVAAAAASATASMTSTAALSVAAPTASDTLFEDFEMLVGLRKAPPPPPAQASTTAPAERANCALDAGENILQVLNELEQDASTVLSLRNERSTSRFESAGAPVPAAAAPAARTTTSTRRTTIREQQQQQQQQPHKPHQSRSSGGHRSKQQILAPDMNKNGHPRAVSSKSKQIHTSSARSITNSNTITTAASSGESMKSTIDLLNDLETQSNRIMSGKNGLGDEWSWLTSVGSTEK